VTGFTPIGGHLHCDGLPVAGIAGAAGTPVYIYSAALIREAHAALDEAFAGYPHCLHYALKANSTLAILRLVRGLGAGADANSGGEIEAALRAGFDPSQIVFTGVGKTRDELECAVALGVKAINIESDGEAERLDAMARARGAKARVALRVNPDIGANTHAHISTGQRFTKFGVPIEFAATLLRRLAGKPGLEVVGLHVHLGSQIMDVEPLGSAAWALADLAREARDGGLRLQHLDLGGGLGIGYDGSAHGSPAEYASAVLPAVRPTGLHLLLEPGRFLVAPAGILVGRVADTKAYAGCPRFVILDTGMTELLRPMLYEAFHRIVEVRPRDGERHDSEVVGPLCETSDTLGHARALGPVEVGDLIAVLDTGAYGFVMASNYNRRPMPAEVLVDGGQWRVIRKRQGVEELFRNEE
jgi:diaminopimelate decarboxylase